MPTSFLPIQHPLQQRTNQPRKPNHHAPSPNHDIPTGAIVSRARGRRTSGLAPRLHRACIPRRRGLRVRARVRGASCCGGLCARASARRVHRDG